jgi:hypothetical protein
MQVLVMQHPLMHWLCAVMAIALTSAVISDCKYNAETVYKGQNAKTSSSTHLVPINIFVKNILTSVIFCLPAALCK